MSDIRAVVFENALAATKSDTPPSPLVIYCGFYVGTAGNVQITDANGEKVLFIGCTAGTIYPIACTQIWSTNTSASNIVVLGARPYKVV